MPSKPMKPAAVLLLAVMASFMVAACGSDDSTAPFAGPYVPPPAKAYEAFESAEGNVACVMDATTGVRCEIRNFSFGPPPRPVSCDLDWGSTVVVHRSAAKFICHGDTVRTGTAPFLKRGELNRAGPFFCLATRAGIRCENRKTDHGFTLSKKSAGTY